MANKKQKSKLAKKLIIERAKRSWSQTDLAQRSGLSLNYIAQVEAGSKKPSIKSLTAMAVAFKIEPINLLNLMDE